MNPLISVIVPTYRRILPLKQALLSVCEQRYPYWEVILVDDNADAEWNQRVAQTADDIRRALPPHASLHLIVNTHNLGSAQSRNVGIRASRGEYITFLDDDDRYLPDKLGTQLNCFQSGKADYSLVDLELFNDNDLKIGYKSHPYIVEVSDPKLLMRYHLMHHLTGTSAMMFRKSYLMQIGCFDGIDIGDEFYLMTKAIEAGGNFAYVPQPLVHARVHFDGSGLSSGPMKLQGENALFAFKKKYFSVLSRKEIRRIRMRHHAVSAFSYLKNKSYLPFLIQAFSCALISPANCLSMIYTRCIQK